MNAEVALREAQRQDQTDHARQVARSRNPTLSAKRTEAARETLEVAQRTLAALEEATETAADELLEVGEAEAEKLANAARQTRERSVTRVEQAAQEIEQAIAEEQAALSVARWAKDPSGRRWKVALASGEVGRPGIRIDRLVAGNAALAPWLAQQPVPGEEVEEPRIHFGWSGGTQAPPGDMRVS